MLCPNCETKNGSSARFCEECGFPLSGAVSRGSMAASPSRQSIKSEPGSKISDLFDFEDGEDSQSEEENRTESSKVTPAKFYMADGSDPFGDDDGGWPFRSQNPQKSLKDKTVPSKKNVPVSIPLEEEEETESVKLLKGAKTFSWNDKAYDNDDESAGDLHIFSGRGRVRSRINTTEAKAAGFFGERNSSAAASPDSTAAMELEALGTAAEIASSPAFAEIMATDYPHLNPNDLDLEDEPFDDSYEELFSLPEDYTDIPSEFGAAYQPVFDLRDDAMKPAEQVVASGKFDSELRPDAPFAETQNAFATPRKSAKAARENRSSKAERAPKERQRTQRTRAQSTRDTRNSQGIQGAQNPQERFNAMGPKKKKPLLPIACAVVVAGAAIVFALTTGIIGGHQVPNVLGLGQDEATKLLEESGFKAEVAKELSDDVEGRIVGESPNPGAFAPDGSKVVISVATPRTIPSIVGKTLDEAKEALEQSGYTNVNFVNQLTNEPENIVLAVNPAPDTRAKSSMEITVTVSQNYKVPAVEGLNAAEAKAAIEKAGLSFRINFEDTTDYPDGTVLGTSPEAGTKMSKGDVVDLRISRTRGIELKGEAEKVLGSGQEISIGDVNYAVESINELTYEGDDIVAFSINAKPFTTLFGEKLYASSSQTITGKIKFSASNEVSSIT